MGDSISKALRERVAACIVGLTPTGRATVTALNLNNPYIVPARRLWALAGWHPPKESYRSAGALP